jgi:hypothetical protein
MVSRPITLSLAASEERSRLLSMDLVRSRALDRLYHRREAMQNLISALEDYQKSLEAIMVHRIRFSFPRKCSSGFAQSRI